MSILFNGTFCGYVSIYGPPGLCRTNLDLNKNEEKDIPKEGFDDGELSKHVLKGPELRNDATNDKNHGFVL